MNRFFFINKIFIFLILISSAVYGEQVIGVGEKRHTEDTTKREEMFKKSKGAKTVPQIFIGDHHVGGNVELQALERTGKLNSLLGI